MLLRAHACAHRRLFETIRTPSLMSRASWKAMLRCRTSTSAVASARLASSLASSGASPNDRKASTRWACIWQIGRTLRNSSAGGGAAAAALAAAPAAALVAGMAELPAVDAARAAFFLPFFFELPGWPACGGNHSSRGAS